MMQKPTQMPGLRGSCWCIFEMEGKVFSKKRGISINKNYIDLFRGVYTTTLRWLFLCFLTGRDVVFQKSRCL